MIIGLLHSLFYAASNFSIQSFSHLLTDMHKVNKPFLPCMLTHNHVGSQVIYWSHLKTQISLAFDVFYQILSCLSDLIKGVMGNDTPDHQFKTSCPACHHQVEGKPNLPIQFNVTGNHPSHTYAIILKGIHSHISVITTSHIWKLIASQIVRNSL